MIDRELEYDDVAAFEDALRDARAAAVAQPNADTSFRAALFLCCRSAWPEALPLLNHAITARRDFIPAYAERGLLYGLNEQYAEAMRDLAYAIHIQPTYHRSWAYRSALHVQRGLWGDVIEDAAKAILHVPTYAPPYKLRAIGYQATKHIALAIEDLRAYLHYCPQAPDRPQILKTMKNLEDPDPPDEPPPLKGWLGRLFGRS